MSRGARSRSPHPVASTVAGVGILLVMSTALACNSGARSDAPVPARPVVVDALTGLSEMPPALPADPQPTEKPGPVAESEPAKPEVAIPEPAVALPVAADGTVASACKDGPTGMSCVPGGPFIRGSNEAAPNAAPEATIWLQTFYIDQNEVTYAEYKACVKERECPRSGPAYTDFDRPQQPINGISWFDAVAYCESKGKRLPTEAQWEKAARGPNGELHPWGDEPATCERAIIKDESGRGCGVLKKGGSKPETGRPWVIGSRPAYRYGLFDMAGNSWEWVADWSSRSYEKCGEHCLGIDPKGPCGGADECPGYNRKIVRGGSWYWPADHATGVYRRSHLPKNRPFHHFGFRCAATVVEAETLRAAPSIGAPEQSSGSAVDAK